MSELSRRSRPAALFALAMLAVAAPAVAQIPDEFTNLKILPKDIGKRELVTTMRSWTSALGQRCTFCHPGPDNLRGVDFASDESEHKQVARRMAQMVTEINTKLLPSSESGEMRVGCVTCHRGLKEPEQIEHVLLEITAADGVEAALARYAELRAEYYGRGSYDFGPQPLVATAEELVERNDAAAARAVLEANVQYHPEDMDAYLLLAQAYMMSRDGASAQATLERALEIDPDDDRLKRMLERLTRNQSGE